MNEYWLELIIDILDKDRQAFVHAIENAVDTVGNRKVDITYLLCVDCQSVNSIIATVLVQTVDYGYLVFSMEDLLSMIWQ